MKQYAICSDDLNKIHEHMIDIDDIGDHFDSIAPFTQNIEYQDAGMPTSGDLKSGDIFHPVSPTLPPPTINSLIPPSLQKTPLTYPFRPSSPSEYKNNLF